MNLEILEEPPAPATISRQFAPSGFRPASDGLVVRFSGIGDGCWLGSFRRGPGNYDRLFHHPNGVDALVIAGGWAYLIDPAAPESARLVRGRVIGAFESLVHHVVVLLYSGIQFEALGPTGTKWKTGSLIFEDVKDIALDASRITGRVLAPFQSTWASFEVDLVSGRTRGAEFLSICDAPEEASGPCDAG